MSLMVGVYSTLEGAQKACDDMGDVLMARGEHSAGATIMEFVLDGGTADLLMYKGLQRGTLN